MDRFEKDFENLDVQSASMENAMSATTTLNAPLSNSLINAIRSYTGQRSLKGIARISM